MKTFTDAIGLTKTEVPSALNTIPQAKPYFPAEERATLLVWYAEILESGALINGKYTRAFEEETAQAVGVKHAIAFNSCTSALQCTLEYIGVADKKVLVPTNTFIATANAVIFAGGTPVIVDIGEDLLINFEQMKKNVDSDTRAVIMVHLGGYIHPQIEEIRNFCEAHDIYLLEDAAHAHGASLNGVQAGGFGFAGAFSYYATKVVATGVGGMLTTDNDGLAARARSVRFHGEDKMRGTQDRLGNDWLMTEFQAALGLVQVRRLEASVEKRMEIARQYDNAFSGVPHVKLFPLHSGARSGYYKYPLLLEAPLDKQKIKKALEEKGIQTGNAYWPPIHLQPVYRERYQYKEGDFPVAERILSNVITLPLFPAMSDAEIALVIDAFLDVTN